jgi:glycosyltransferase involved in cell wall biosynthesis
VAPNGVALKRFTFSGSKESMRKSIGLPIEKTVVGFSGHLYKGRGIEELLECAKVLDQIFFLIVGGESADILRNKSFAQDLGLSNVEFAGFVPQANVPNYLFACDVLVMPYTEATVTHNFMSPMKMFEYLASGRPIVATDFPVIREILVDKKNSVLVTSNSAGALAWGIKWVIEHPEDAKRISEQARRDAEQYSWEKRVKRVVSWLGEWFNI